MKCPNCHSEHTRLSWLREFTVVYWCPQCHQGFELNRHRSRLQYMAPLSPEHEVNGATPAAAQAS